MGLNRARSGLGLAALLAGGALGGCAWDEGVVTAPTTTTSTTEAPAEVQPPPPPTPPPTPPPPVAGQGGATTTTTTQPPATTTTRPPTTTTTRPPAGSRTHTVQPGDTLYALAQANGIPLARLVAANPGIDPSALTVGDVIVIPPPG